MTEVEKIQKQNIKHAQIVVVIPLYDIITYNFLNCFCALCVACISTSKNSPEEMDG
jgi:hypothetical protein